MLLLTACMKWNDVCLEMSYLNVSCGTETAVARSTLGPPARLPAFPSPYSRLDTALRSCPCCLTQDMAKDCKLSLLWLKK